MSTKGTSPVLLEGLLVLIISDLPEYSVGTSFAGPYGHGLMDNLIRFTMQVIVKFDKRLSKDLLGTIKLHHLKIPKTKQNILIEQFSKGFHGVPILVQCFI